MINLYFTILKIKKPADESNNVKCNHEHKNKYALKNRVF